MYHLLEPSKEEWLVEVELLKARSTLPHHTMTTIHPQDASPLFPAHPHHMPGVEGDARGTPTSEGINEGYNYSKWLTLTLLWSFRFVIHDRQHYMFEVIHVFYFIT